MDEELKNNDAQEVLNQFIYVLLDKYLTLWHPNPRLYTIKFIQKCLNKGAKIPEDILLFYTSQYPNQNKQEDQLIQEYDESWFVRFNILERYWDKLTCLPNLDWDRIKKDGYKFKALDPESNQKCPSWRSYVLFAIWDAKWNNYEANPFKMNKKKLR